ncbi:MAG: glutamate racemase [Methylovirgula sp.]
MSKPPHVLIFDSGLGGLTVLAEVMRLRPDVSCLFAADDAGFPYGRLAEPALIARVGTVVAHLISDYAPDAVIIACNTAATAVLPHLRASYPQIPFIGTVPAVKPAAAQSRSKLISVLATPGTVARDYTHDLVRTYAAHCDVTLVGSTQLASLAEACMKGEDVADAAIVAEIAPSFVEKGGQRTDCIVLACTHYPLLLKQFERLASWPVAWIDPAEAIARRLDHVLQEKLGVAAPDTENWPQNAAMFTSGAVPSPALAKALHERGIGGILENPIPMAIA